MCLVFSSLAAETRRRVGAGAATPANKTTSASLIPEDFSVKIDFSLDIFRWFVGVNLDTGWGGTLSTAPRGASIGGHMRDRRNLFVVATLLAVIAVSGAGLLTRIVTAVGEPRTASADPPLPPLDHFECYEIKPGFFVNTTATVQDQFGTMSEMIRFPHRLCNPTNKNNEGITDPADHLAGYVVNAPKFTKMTNQTIQNQFGTTLVDVVRPDLLMVPTAKDGVALTPPPVDHFQCYKVKRSKGSPKFTKRTASISNQFETVTVTLVKPVRLCAPANKNHEDPTAPTHPEHLLCYKTKGTPFGQSTHTIDNQFGHDDVTMIKRKELCLPSLKHPQTTTTTTTSTTSTTTTSTSSTTSTTAPYGSPSRAFLEKVSSLLE